MAVSCCCRLAKALRRRTRSALMPGDGRFRTRQSCPHSPKLFLRDNPCLEPLKTEVQGKRLALELSPMGDLAEGDKDPGHQTILLH